MVRIPLMNIKHRAALWIKYDFRAVYIIILDFFGNLVKLHPTLCIHVFGKMYKGLFN